MKKDIVLLHGWNWHNYSRFGCTDAWKNRTKLVRRLEEHFNVHYFNFPGFCGEPEPNESWNVDDFADFFQNYLLENNLKPDFVLGYSFGGAVAVAWKSKNSNNIPVILVSPALCRAYSGKSVSAGWFKKILPERIIDFAREFYLSKIVKNLYYANGTKFLSSTYLKIVREDLSSRVSKIPWDEKLLIFGARDTATPPDLLLEKLGAEIRKSTIVIEGGAHDIANTHTTAVMKHILSFAKRKEGGD